MGDYSDLVESLPLFHASPDFVSTFSALSEDAPSVKDWPEKPFMLHFATRLWGRWVALAYLGDERFVALSIEETDDDYELAVVSDTKWGRLISWIIDNPDLMEKTPRDLRPKAERRQRNKSRPDRPRLVTIVDLRAAHREAAADVAAAERTYRSRWIVRGHWHRFWTGPRDGERKLETRYVMPYVKGPAGAPLNVTERVKKW
ncbi:hypothetical protein [Parasutterella excrementihominis]|nr:hypothetical protein [Parasutterella excrementihominis]